MARFVSELLLVVVGLAAFASAQEQAVPRQCGYDRWPVKILSDNDRAHVNFTPVDATVAKLAAIPIHEIPYPQANRIAPEEFQVYRVRARLLRVRREKDSDLHLLLADLDTPEIRMIAEIPAPECAVGTGHEQEYKAAREVILTVPPNTIVELVGVAFFDYLHEQHGAAKNGIELHPVFRLEALRSR